jgi:hypothetical protein
MQNFAIILITLFSMLGASCAQGSTEDMFWKPKEENFWKWFQANESRLFDFEQDQDRVFGELGPEMKKVHPDLTFEFGPKKDGRREFVISADGNRNAFPAVVALADKAPELQRWEIIKFRQRRGRLPDLGYEGTRVKSEDIEFTIEPDRDKAGITLFIKGYDETSHQRLVTIGFLYLDSTLGEYDVETKVGFVNFKAANEQTTLVKRPISELPKVFDDFVASRLN